MTHTFRKLLSLFLVLSITLSVCSCSFLTRIRHQISNSISEQELIRLVVEAVDDGNSLSDSFAAIPEAQRVGVSFSHFKEYVDIMRKMSSAREITAEDGRPARRGVKCGKMGIFTTGNRIGAIHVHPRMLTGNASVRNDHVMKGERQWHTITQICSREIR